MMQQCWVVMYIAVAIMAANGYVQDLRVDVVPIQTRFAAVQDVNVILKYSNVGSDTMAICKWYLPEKELFDPIFEVTRNGKPVEYVGPVAKRRAPTADDVIYLTPGMTVSAAIQLSTVYNMTQTGNYVVQYKMNADEVLPFTTNNMLKDTIMSSNDGQESILQSAPVVLFAVGRRNLLIEQAIEFNTRGRALTPTYSYCTSTQTNSIKSGVIAAENYANDAKQHLSGTSMGTARYTTWFGRYSSTNWNTATSHFTKIQSILSTKTLSFDCSCPAHSSSATYAYVYPNQHYKIYLCSEFWPSSTTGTDSKGGTIIHEVAHFIVAAGTQDHAYGQSKCQNLAKSNPSMALANSDNLQYFAENNPRM